MKRRDLLGAAVVAPLLPGCAVPAASGLSGSGDLGVVVERSRGALALVKTSRRELLAEIGGLGDQ